MRPRGGASLASFAASCMAAGNFNHAEGVVVRVMEAWGALALTACAAARIAPPASCHGERTPPSFPTHYTRMHAFGHGTPSHVHVQAADQIKVDLLTKKVTSPSAGCRLMTQKGVKVPAMYT